MKIVQDYQGRDVRLTDERLRHILEHSEMADLERGIEETIRHPQFVIESRTDPEAELNYRFFVGTKVGDKWLCVVIKYSIGDAFVVTAYLTDQLKKGRQIWPIE
jgi:hypothetical protein